MPLAIFHRSPQQEALAKIADDHFEGDLEPEDRSELRAAVAKVGYHATVGSALGLGLGLYFAWRMRKVRVDVFNAMRAVEKPVQVVFANGRTEPIPDMTALMQPTRFGDIAAYVFFGAGGFLLGGEAGFLTGSWSASRSIRQNPAREQRIENAYRRFRADYLRKEADRLERGGSIWEQP